MQKKIDHESTLGFLRFSIGILFALEASLALVYYFLEIPEATFVYIALVMGLTSAVALGFVFLIFRRGWISQIPHLRWTILGGYRISMLIIVSVIAIITNRVFEDIHDVLLTATLLFFGSGIFISFGYVLTRTLSQRIEILNSASQQISRGNLTERVPVTGKDEIAALSATFNQMAGQLQEMDAHQKKMRQSRNVLFAWVGHDLRTPLTSIRAMLEALTDEVVDDPATRKRYLEMAKKEIGYLSRLIDDLIDLARMDAEDLTLKREDVVLPDMISDTLESFYTLARQNQIEFTGSVEPGIYLVHVDARMINRVFNNLVSNAIRHTPVHGKVTITAKRANGKIQVTVADNGEGIEEEDLPHIFDRFYRGEKSRSRLTGGSGLGLAIARGIIEAHGEVISVESEPKEGTKFIFTLPESG